MPKRLNKAEKELKEKIIASLKSQGFKINPYLRPPRTNNATYKKIQNAAKLEQLESHGKFLRAFASKAKEIMINGSEIDPQEISLKLIEVKPNSFNAELFRWWNLVWWSMPYQHAYGRQMRFILWDTYHDAPFGLFLLQSPVLRSSARDKYLKIPLNKIDYWVNQSMNAQRVGALPPYNMLIGGKMATLAMISNEVRKAYRKKYKDRTTLLDKRVLEPNILFITTTSAFGKSSMYDRLTYDGKKVAIMIGHTKGMGTFQFSDYITRGLYGVLQRRDINTSTTYGNGPSKKIKLLREALNYMGLRGFHSHGIRREVYLLTLVKNLERVIHDGMKPRWYNRTFSDLEEYWKERWALPRSNRMSEWKEFDSRKFMRKVTAMIK